MAGQPQWRLIDQTLDQIHREISGEPDLVNDARLKLYCQILRNSLRSIRNSGHLVHAETLAAKRIPREYRYRVNQSLRAQQSNLVHVHQKAETILQKLREMAGDPPEESTNLDMTGFGQALESIDISFQGMIIDPADFQKPGFNAPLAPGAVMPVQAIIALIIYYLLQRYHSK